MSKNVAVFVDVANIFYAAKAAGVEEGDRLTAINGTPIRHFADVKIAMIDQQPGNDVEVTLKRDRLLGGEKTETVSFQLVGPAPAVV